MERRKCNETWSYRALVIHAELLSCLHQVKNHCCTSPTRRRHQPDTPQTSARHDDIVSPWGTQHWWRDLESVRGNRKPDRRSETETRMQIKMQVMRRPRENEGPLRRSERVPRVQIKVQVMKR